MFSIRASRSVFATLIWCFVGVSCLSSLAQAKKQQPTQQCSFAVVSKLMAGSQNICDDGTVMRLAHEGHVYEQNQLGIASVLAIRQDYTTQEALNWFRKAALKGYAPAQVNLAVMYGNGWGTPRNYAAALQWLKAASDQHYARADYNLGIFFMQGTGVRQDYGEAFRWFKKAAEEGDGSGQTNLGYLYDRGLGVKADSAVAVSWYEKAARGGNPLGEYNLGDMYLRGEGIAQSDSQALHWFEKAAEQGHTGAQIKLAYMYAQGRGTKADPEYAYTLLTAASKAGDDRGRELAASLERTLSAKQIADAKSRAADLQVSSRAMTATEMEP
jgi:TPR repeat protein